MRPDLKLGPVVFFELRFGAGDDDVRPELADVHFLVGGEAALHVLPGFLVDDQVGRAVGEGDAFIHAGRGW